MTTARPKAIAASLLLCFIASDSASAASLAAPFPSTYQSLEEGADSIPDMITAGTVEERISSCENWIAGLLLFRAEGGVHETLNRNFKSWIDLNFELATSERYEEAIELCESLFDALADAQTRKLRVAYLWFKNELHRDRYAAAEEALDKHAALQALASEKKKQRESYAWELGYYLAGRAELAHWRGLSDRAYAYRSAAEPCWEKAYGRYGEKRLRILRHELDKLAVDIALGQSLAQEALESSRQHLETIAEQVAPANDPSPRDLELAGRWNRNFRLREALALHLLALAGEVPQEEATQHLLALKGEEGLSVDAQFDVSLKVWELYQRTSKVELANQEALHANALASSSEQIASVRSLELVSTLASGVSPAAEEASFTKWRTSFDTIVARWLEDPPRAGGSSIMAFEERRRTLWAGIKYYLHRNDVDGAFNLYLESERIGSLSRLLRERYGERSVLDARAVQDSLLAPGEVVLVPIPVRLGSQLFVVDERGVRCLPIKIDSRTYAAARELESLISRPPSAGEDQAARRTSIQSLGEDLRKSLLPDDLAEACLNASLVTVVDDHVQGRLPFDLVHVDGKMLCELVPMAEVASLDVRASLAARPFNAQERNLSIATNVPAQEALTGTSPTGLEPLTLAPSVTDRLIPSEAASAALLTGALATEERVKAEVLNSASVVTFVAHGYADYDRERPATLWLGSDSEGDGLLSADEIEELSNVADVVLLATCGAASGAYRTGDAGAGHLGGALTMAGARCVILASGQLPVEATLFAVERIHHHLIAGGQSVASALRLARNDVAGRQGFEDPSFFAQLRVYGLGDHVPFPRSSAPKTYSLALALVGLLVASGAIFALARRRA